MNLNINRRILLTTIFAIAATLAILVTSATGTSMLTPAFAQGENMTDVGNYTDGNMTGTDMAESGMASPPIIAP